MGKTLRITLFSLIMAVMFGLIGAIAFVAAGTLFDLVVMAGYQVFFLGWTLLKLFAAGAIAWLLFLGTRLIFNLVKDWLLPLHKSVPGQYVPDDWSGRDKTKPHLRRFRTTE